MKGTRIAVAIGCLMAVLTVGEAGAQTLVVSFDDLVPNTTVTDQNRATHGVSFAGPAADGAFPIVKETGAAHSGGQVADISFCFACEFYTPRTVGRLDSLASSVGMYVGYLGPDVGNAPADVRLTVADASGETIASASTTVVQGQPFDQQLSVTSPGGAPAIASFEVIADPPNMSQSIGFDDLALTYPDVQPPPDFALTIGDGPARQGGTIDVPVGVTRLNGSNGNVMLNAIGLPPGVSATFSPNPVTGTDTATTLQLSVAQSAAPTGFTPLTITGVPDAGAGTGARSTTLSMRVVHTCGVPRVELASRPPPGDVVPSYRVSSSVELNAVLHSDFVGRVIVPRDEVWELLGCDGLPLGNIPLQSGVSLVGERGELGSRPTLFTNYMGEKYTVFTVVGNDIHVEGLNFLGPKPAADHAKKDKYVDAILVRQDIDRDVRAFGHRVTIVDNEFSQWPHAGVSVKGCLFLDDEGTGCEMVNGDISDWDPAWPHLEPSDADTLFVGYNYMHDNVMDGGGYGFVTGAAGYGTVVGNVFDRNRHAVAASGRAYSGYVALYNYVLNGGYKQGNYYNQHFDVHGNGEKDYGGYGGEYFEIGYNTIRGEQTYHLVKTRPALMMRGTPGIELYFHHNVLVHDDLDAAVSLKDSKNSTGIGEDHDEFNFRPSKNKFDTDYTTEIATGDFDGDGHTDVFTANGTAWYYSSAGNREWRYLRQWNKRIRDLAFADIDNDGITDALYRDANGELSFLKSARSDLMPLTTLPVPIKDLRSGDFDGDGLTDLFYTQNQQWQIWYGSTGQWSPAQTSVTPVNEMLFGEFDSNSGTDVAAVRNGQWSYSSGGLTQWQKLNNKLVGSFKNAVAADFDGNGRTDIGFINETKWRYSRDGTSKLVVLRNGIQTHGPLLIGDFLPIDGDSSRAQVVGWRRVVDRIDPNTGKVFYTAGTRLSAWYGLGTGNDFRSHSAFHLR